MLESPHGGHPELPHNSTDARRHATPNDTFMESFDIKREVYNVPKSDMHANPKSYIRRLVEPKGYLCYYSSFWRQVWRALRAN